LADEARERQLGSVVAPGPLRLELEEHGFEPGDPVFIRIFKQLLAPRGTLKPFGMGVLEVWVAPKNKAYSLLHSMEIARFSGQLGPKVREGDNQAPEGFYAVVPGNMNPLSQYHLAMNVGYPNALDRQLDRTGNYIMIHGSNVSEGCFAMTDQGIEEIYVLVEAALNAGQHEVPVHIFPFPLTPGNMAQAQGLPPWDFWAMLVEGFRLFEQERVPPEVWAENERYRFGSGLQ